MNLVRPAKYVSWSSHIAQGISEATARQGLITAADSGDQPSGSVPIPACDKDEELRDYRC
jgi:hypothetical protein